MKPRPQTSTADAIKIFLASNEYHSVGNSRRREHRFRDRIRREHFVLRARFYHECVAVFAGQKNLPIEGYRRSGERSRYRNASAFINDLAGLRFEARDDPAIRQQVKIIPIEQ